MYGFGVGFGLGEFGSGGFAIEVDVLSTVTMVADAGMTAEGTLTTAAGVITAQLTAASSLAIDPAGIAVVFKKTRQARPVTVTAKPTTVQGLRVVPQPVRHVYHIPRDPKRGTER